MTAYKILRGEIQKAKNDSPEKLEARPGLEQKNKDDVGQRVNQSRGAQGHAHTSNDMV